MLFRKLNDLQFFRLKLETYSEAEVLASALLYFEYRVKYNTKKSASQAKRCRQCLVLLHDSILDNERFYGFECIHEMCYLAYEAMKENGWLSMECMLDGLELRAGGSGSMPYQLKAALVGVVKNFLEDEWGLPVTKIIRRADEPLEPEASADE